MGYVEFMKIYTRTGDKGQTSLFGGERVSKSHQRVSAYGTLDELNSYLGICGAVCREEMALDSLASWIEGVQKDLFALGSWLANPKACENIAAGKAPYEGARHERTTLNDTRITELENDIDAWETELEPMRSFILPSGALPCASLQYARTLCRRSERECVALMEKGEIIPELAIRYLNRLADALFVLARYANKKLGVAEIPWQ